MTRQTIPLGMVGGGQGAFIGAVHQIAARLDGRFELVAGALSSDPVRAEDSGREIGLRRIYADYKKMAASESAREDGIRAVAIVTPNHLHLPIARVFLEQGIHVICEKPLTATLIEAEQLARVAEKAQALLVLTHTYAGYPMLREARRIVAEGQIGRVRLVNAEYVQDWLTTAVDSKQAEWRLDPKRSGEGGAITDIGSHAAHLAGFVSGLSIDAVCAELHSFVEGRPVDDNAHVMMRMGHARGMIWASQVSPGFDNDIRLRVIGEHGGLEWNHSAQDVLRLTKVGEPSQILTRGGPAFANRARVPAGHPEGYLEAFATLYSDAADAIVAGAVGKDLPGISAGLDGMKFITACIRSSRSNGAWTKLDQKPGDRD